MSASYLIGLREGLEAVLVVSILIAFLVKTDRRGYLWQVWAGVGAAVALSVGVGALLTYSNARLTFQQQELFEAVTSLLAVGFVTWMIFWMRRMARRISGELRAKLDEAIKLGPVAVILMAFLAVAREGLETALFFFVTVQGAATTSAPLIGVVLGVLTAIVIGWLLYATTIRINLGRFFTWTGALLILVAAGICKYAIHDFQEAGTLPGLNDHAFDISHLLRPDAWYAELLRGMFNITPQPSVLEVLAWAGYALPVLVLFLWPARQGAARGSADPAPTADPAPSARSETAVS